MATAELLALVGDALQVSPAPRAVFEPLSLVLHARGPMFFMVWLLIATSAVVWLTAVLKFLQLRRLRKAEDRLDEQLSSIEEVVRPELVNGDSVGSHVLGALHREDGPPELLEATAEREVARQWQRVSSLMVVLSTVGAVAPLVGLLGTVYGIMEAFLLVGATKTVSLQVLGPAIGEALLTTALGLAAAIPAVVLHNFLSKRIEALMDRVQASSRAWVKMLTLNRERGGAVPRSSASPRPAGRVDAHLELVPQARA